MNCASRSTSSSLIQTKPGPPVQQFPHCVQVNDNPSAYHGSFAGNTSSFITWILTDRDILAVAERIECFMFNLEGKIAAITGAGSGIGAAVAHAFSSAGAFVYVLDRDVRSGEEIVSSLSSAKDRAKFLAVDVSNEATCAAIGHQILKEHGRCDILVNNAGIGHVGTVLSTTAEDLDRLYAVNVKGILHMTRAILPSMIARKWGSVVNLASIGGVIAVKDRFAYCTTKFAVVGMTKCMAVDHADSKVRFNAICPGRVETPFVQARIKEYPDPKKAYEEMSSTQLLKRMGRPEEIAAAALYLAADESAFVTGSCLIIDGGMSAA
jgi:NAD(P)-dependent dehydrogenase (short-subunit alcohol dehydrogenase family)